MRRGILILIALIVVVLLVMPFDCFATGASSQTDVDCCLKGKCAPTAKSDECCKNTVPDGNQFVPSKAADHSSGAAWTENPEQLYSAAERRGWSSAGC